MSQRIHLTRGRVVLPNRRLLRTRSAVILDFLWQPMGSRCSRVEYPRGQEAWDKEFCNA